MCRKDAERIEEGVSGFSGSHITALAASVRYNCQCMYGRYGLQELQERICLCLDLWSFDLEFRELWTVCWLAARKVCDVYSNSP